MNRRELIKLSLLSGVAVLLPTKRTNASAAATPATGGFFDPPSPEIMNPFTVELPRMSIKASLPGGVNDLSLPVNGAAAPNGTVYPQVTGLDALTTYRNSLERIVAHQQRNSIHNIQYSPQQFYVLRAKQAKHI